MTVVTPQALLSRLVDEFERCRWRDVDQAALSIVHAIERGTIDPQTLAQIPSRSFLSVNGTTRAEVHDALQRAVTGVKLETPRPPLIPIEEIDSFAAAADVSPQDVASLAARTLPIGERTVKEFITHIIGEPYLDTDWGGELSDIMSSRVVLGGRRVTGAFLLKGSGSKRKLSPKDLGANGDQVRRLSKQDAGVYVVQHVGEFSEAVRDTVSDMVLARRSEGADVVGSVWDGSDCARLFIAHGLIDPATGQPVDPS